MAECQRYRDERERRSLPGYSCHTGPHDQVGQAISTVLRLPAEGSVQAGFTRLPTDLQ